MQCIQKVNWVAVVALSIAGISNAQSKDIHSELTEWVFDPCMQVAAAIEVNIYDQETINSGVKRKHIAEIMLASRQSAISEAVKLMKKNATWKERSAAYPFMLKVCLGQFIK